MTCIVGLKHDGKVYIGADSVGSDGYTNTLMKSPKVFVLPNGMVIGYTTSFRFGQLLEYNLGNKLADAGGGESDMQYMVTVFVEEVRNVLKDGGFSTINNNVEEGGNLLVAYNGNLYELHTDFCILEYLSDWAACGSGATYAYGAFYATQGQDPVSRVRMALKAGMYYSPSVQSPFHIATKDGLSMLEDE